MRRKLLIVAGVILGIVVLAILGIWLALPSERLAAAAAARLESRVGRPVRIADLGIDLFPAPAVRLDGVAIGDAVDGAGGDVADDYARIDAVLLRPRLLPLLFGRVIVDRAVVLRPELALRIDGAGLDSVFTRAAEPSRTGEGRDLVFALEHLSVRRGRLRYSDPGNATRIDARGWSQELRLSGTVREGRVERVGADGTIRIEALDLAMPERIAFPIRDLALTLEHDALLDRPADRLALDAIELRLQAVTLTGAGAVTGLSDHDARAITLDLATDEFDAAALLRSVPESALAALTGGGTLPEIEGRGRIEAAVRGALPPAGMPDVAGTLTLDGVAIEHDTWGRVLEGLQGTVAFSLDSLSARDLRARLWGEPVRLGAAVPELSAPVVRFETSGALELARATPIFVSPDSLSADGRATFDLRGSIPLETPEASEARGTIDLAGTRVTTPSLARPVTVAGRLRLEGRRLRSERLRVSVPGGDVEVELTADGWVPRLFGDTTAVPSATVMARGAAVDLDALLPAPEGPTYTRLLFARLAGRSVDGRDVAEIAADRGLSLPTPPPARIRASIELDQLVFRGFQLGDVMAEIAADPGEIRVDRLRFGLLGGTVETSGRLTPDGAESGAPALMTLDYDLLNVGAGAFFDRLTPFRQHIAGDLRLAGSAALGMDRLLLPDRESLLAGGTIAVSGGTLRNWTVLDRLGDRLGLQTFDTLRFRDWSGRFDIVGPLVRLLDTSLQGEAVRALMAGSFDFGGRLDIGATLHLSARLAQQAIPEISGLVDAATTDEIGIGLRIQGNTAQPQIALDLSETRDALMARARDTAERKAADALTDVAREAAEALGIADRLGLGRDSATATADTAAVDSGGARPDSAVTARPDSAARRAIESVVRGGLERLLGARRDTTRRDSVPRDTLRRDTVPRDTVPPDTASGDAPG